MTIYRVTVHLSNDFNRSTNLAYGFDSASDTFAQAAADGVYDLADMTFPVAASSHSHAAEIAWGICNSYPATVADGTFFPAELFCDQSYADVVMRYRQASKRSLSIGDVVEVTTGTHPEDGFYAAMRVGFELLPEIVALPVPKVTVPFAPTFNHHLDGLPAAILPEPPDHSGRVSVWMDGHTYRVNMAALRPLI
jgi:hypothetical protein